MTLRRSHSLCEALVQSAKRGAARVRPVHHELVAYVNCQRNQFIAAGRTVMVAKMKVAFT